MDINEYARGYEAATKYFADRVAGLSDSDLDRSRPGEWSPRQVIHHVADSEAQSYARLRRLIAEPAGSAIQGYDESGWGKNQTLGYKELPIANSLAVYLAVRASSLDIIKRLKMEDLERYGEQQSEADIQFNTGLRCIPGIRSSMVEMNRIVASAD